MASRRSSAAVAAAYFAVLTAASPVARGAGEINQQVLQGVGAFNASSALDMLFDASAAERATLGRDFEKFDISRFATLRSCQRNATRGLYCLDGPFVRRWTDPEIGGASQDEFRCDNAQLKLSGTDFCTALAVAQNGDVWIAGRRKGASVLIRLREKSNGLPTGSCVGVVNKPLLGSTDRYCYQEFGIARPLLSKLVVIDGDEATGFDRGAGPQPDGVRGVLGLDIRNAVTYSSLNPSEAPIDLVTKSQWLLLQKETLQDLTLLQTESNNPADPINNHLLVTTSLGRVLRYQTDQGASSPRVGDVFDVLDDGADSGAALCTLAGTVDRFGIAASNKTGRVYVSNRNRCQVVALEPATDIRIGGLVHVDETPSGDDLTLSTTAVVDSTTVAYPPDGVTVAPGIAVNFDECRAVDETQDGKAGCTVIALQNGTSTPKTILRFTNVERPAGAVGPAGGTVFQIDNIPDCRYRLYYASLYDVPDPVCNAFDPSEIIVPVAGTDRPDLPGNQFLNIRAMFPPEVADQFTGDNALKGPILISPQYRARRYGSPENPDPRDMLFGAIVVVPDPDLVLVNTYDAYFSVGELLNGVDEGPERCEPPPASPPAPPPTLGRLLAFDVVTRASETYIAPGGIGGPADFDYVDTIVNTGCGSTRKSGGSFSVISYGLEIAHNPGEDAQGWLYDPIEGPPETLGGPPTLSPNPDADDDDDVYARLVRKLFDDLGVFQKQIACRSNVDAPGSLPLPSCGVINASYDNTLDKLGKCIDATRQPKTSAVDQNCNAFEVQFAAYQSEVVALDPRPEFDPANRIGELEARLRTIWLLYHDRFLPSVPQGGYTP
jgi:hypothetical protein